MQKFYVDAGGKFIGAFSGHQPDPILIVPEEGDSYFQKQDYVWPEIPDGAIEVPSAPNHALDVWIDGAWVAAMIVPESITPLQGLRAIDAAGLSIVYAAWANSDDRTFLERAFIDKAQTWRRDDPVLNTGAAAMGLSADSLDQLFIQAAQL